MHAMLTSSPPNNVFYSRTSSGKSHTIDSIIGSQIMPVGKGHTTDKIVCVYGGDETKILVTSDKGNDEVCH